MLGKRCIHFCQADELTGMQERLSKSFHLPIVTVGTVLTFLCRWFKCLFKTVSCHNSLHFSLEYTRCTGFPINCVLFIMNHIYHNEPTYISWTSVVAFVDIKSPPVTTMQEIGIRE